MSQLWYVVAWWLVLQLIALAVLPATLRIFRNLPDAGWAFARPVGLVFVGFLFWHGATFGLLSNAWPSILGVVLVVAALGWTLAWREAVQLGAFVQARRAEVVAVEALFTLAFLLWTVVRAHDPGIGGTEKPMEIAFLNGVLRSEQFPPIDPWLSGYAISYYYFGYVITGMVTRFAGVPPEFGFNLMLPTLFALTATGAYAIGAALHAGSRGGNATARRTIGAGLAAVVLVLCLSNLEPVLEVLNANRALPDAVRRYFADNAAPGAGSMKDMPPAYDGRGLLPTDFLWWWRATRIVSTPGPRGAPELDYTIGEFPAFSFVHGDLHPHVLALPFVFPAIAFALNLLRAPGDLSPARLWRDRWTLAPALVLFGALGFLNAWDMPTYLFLLTLAFGTHRVLSRGALDRRVLREIAYGLPAVGVLCVLVYLPFWLILRSQASGLGVVLTHTQAVHFLLFWGPLYLTVATLLATQVAATWHDAPAGGWTRRKVVWSGTLALAAVAFVLRAPAVGFTLPFIVAAVALWSRHTRAAGVARSVAAEPPPGPPAVARRREPVEIAGAAVPTAAPREHLFVLLMALTGLLLVFGCELFYIRDLFNNRMNTVFKLYYQAWALLGLAAAYALPLMAGRIGRLGRAARVAASAWTAVLGLVLAGGLLYPLAATLSKTDYFRGTPTLDGYAFWARARADDMAGIQWLRQNAPGTPVVVEATGGSYRDEFARVSRMTGLPTLLGWAFHEQQWRGTFDEQGRRKPDIDAIYTSADALNVQTLLRTYDVTYVYVGPTEREAYRGSNLDRFAEFMDVAYRRGSVSIYRVRGRPN
jgi:YYY domain-containing protein